MYFDDWGDFDWGSLGVQANFAFDEGKDLLEHTLHRRGLKRGLKAAQLFLRYTKVSLS